MPISILNQKSQSINQIELSTSMDVIAISTKDGLISLYRIFTWYIEYRIFFMLILDDKLTFL